MYNYIKFICQRLLTLSSDLFTGVGQKFMQFTTLKILKATVSKMQESGIILLLVILECVIIKYKKSISIKYFKLYVSERIKWLKILYLLNLTTHA